MGFAVWCVYGRSAFAAKQERLKQAKAEAERDIAAYRAQRETGFQQALANVRTFALGLRV